jgi:hypothetical protein
MASSSGQKELKRNWPVVSGILADSKHEGRTSNLVANESIVLSKERRGIN